MPTRRACVRSLVGALYTGVILNEIIPTLPRSYASGAGPDTVNLNTACGTSLSGIVAREVENYKPDL